MALNIDSKVKDLVANKQCAQIIDKYIPGFSTAPQIQMAMGMTLRTVCGFPQTGISKEKVAELAAELEALGL
ncbi:MAG: hypothetical protein ACOX8A_08420 [Thermacetogeniaceae bacterium]